jgi:hypothetical protein
VQNGDKIDEWYFFQHGTMTLLSRQAAFKVESCKSDDQQTTTPPEFPKESSFFVLVKNPPPAPGSLFLGVASCTCFGPMYSHDF